MSVGKVGQGAIGESSGEATGDWELNPHAISSRATCGICTIPIINFWAPPKYTQYAPKSTNKNAIIQKCPGPKSQNPILGRAAKEAYAPLQTSP